MEGGGDLPRHCPTRAPTTSHHWPGQRVPPGGGDNGVELQQGDGEGKLFALLLRSPPLSLQPLRRKVISSPPQIHSATLDTFQVRCQRGAAGALEAGAHGSVEGAEAAVQLRQVSGELLQERLPPQTQPHTHTVQAEYLVKIYHVEESQTLVWPG